MMCLPMGIWFILAMPLKIMDFTDSINPILLGRIALPSMVRGLALRDNKMDVANYNGGLRIIDVSDPATPVKMGAVEKIGTALDLVIDRGNADIVAGKSSSIIVDIANPSNPSKVGQLENTVYTPSVAVIGDYAYACIGKMSKVANIADSTKPTEITKVDLLNFPEEVTIQGNYLDLSCDNGGLRIFDLTNPVELGLLQNVQLIRRIAIQNDRAYLARSSQGMSVINIATASAPVEVSHFRTGTHWMGLDVQGDDAYLTGGENIRIIDCADVTNPTSISHLDTGNYDCDAVVVSDHCHHRHLLPVASQ